MNLLELSRLIPCEKMVFLLNSRPVDALALIVHRSAEQAVGRAWVKKLRMGLTLSFSYV
jgi:translation elongation factor EF-4